MGICIVCCVLGRKCAVMGVSRTPVRRFKFVAAISFLRANLP